MLCMLDPRAAGGIVDVMADGREQRNRLLYGTSCTSYGNEGGTIILLLTPMQDLCD